MGHVALQASIKQETFADILPRMGALLIGAAVTVIAAFGAAWLGARLQRKWTPNLIPSIEALGDRIPQLRQHVDAIEEERIESEHFTLTMRLTQAAAGNYILDVRNDTDKDVTVETVQLFRGDAPLSDPSKPRPNDNWLIPAHSGKQLWWSPQPDPVSTLLYSEPNLPQGVAVPVGIVLACRSSSKPRTARRTLLVTVDYRNHTMTQFGP